MIDHRHSILAQLYIDFHTVCSESLSEPYEFDRVLGSRKLIRVSSPCPMRDDQKRLFPLEQRSAVDQLNRAHPFPVGIREITENKHASRCGLFAAYQIDASMPGSDACTDRPCFRAGLLPPIACKKK